MTDGQDATPTDPPGEVLARNIERIRKEQRLTYVEVARRLEEDARRPIPVLGLRRIEQGKRRVDVADLLALAYVLGVTPVDLLVPATAADDEPYEITPGTTVTAGAVRAWIGGRWLREPETAAELAKAFQGMPKARAEALSREWFTPERQRETSRSALEYDRQEQEGGGRASEQDQEG